MSAWSWMIVGIGGFLALSFVVAFAVAAILGRIGQEVSELLEAETWASVEPWADASSAADQRKEEHETLLAQGSPSQLEGASGRARTRGIA